MNIGLGKKIIVVNSDGAKWLFYIGDGQRLFFKKADINNNIIKESIVDDHAIIDFSIDSDINNKIHILIYTLTKCIIYITTSDGEDFSKITLSKVNYRTQSLNDITIIVNNNIHIFYVIKTSMQKSTDTLIHYVSENNGWTGEKIDEFKPENDVRLQKVILTQSNELHIFISLKQNISAYTILYNKFSKDCRRSDFNALYSSSSYFQYFDAFIDTNGIKYCAWNSNNQVFFNGLAISNQSSNNSCPCIKYNNGNISCIWLEDGILSEKNVNAHKVESPNTIQETDKVNQPEREFYYLATGGIRSNTLIITQIISARFPYIDPVFLSGNNILKTVSSIQKPLESEIESNVSKIMPDNNIHVNENDNLIKDIQHDLLEYDYRIKQLEEKVFNHQKALFTVEAQLRKILNDIDKEKIPDNFSQMEAFKIALQSMEAQLVSMKNMINK